MTTDLGYVPLSDRVPGTYMTEHLFDELWSKYTLWKQTKQVNNNDATLSPDINDRKTRWQYLQTHLFQSSPTNAEGEFQWIFRHPMSDPFLQWLHQNQPDLVSALKAIFKPSLDHIYDLMLEDIRTVISKWSILAQQEHLMVPFQLVDISIPTDDQDSMEIVSKAVHKLQANWERFGLHFFIIARGSTNQKYWCVLTLNRHSGHLELFNPRPDVKDRQCDLAIQQLTSRLGSTTTMTTTSTTMQTVHDVDCGSNECKYFSGLWVLYQIYKHIQINPSHAATWPQPTWIGLLDLFFVTSPTLKEEIAADFKKYSSQGRGIVNPDELKYSNTPEFVEQFRVALLYLSHVQPDTKKQHWYQKGLSNKGWHMKDIHCRIQYLMEYGQINLQKCFQYVHYDPLLRMSRHPNELDRIDFLRSLWSELMSITWKPVSPTPGLTETWKSKLDTFGQDVFKLEIIPYLPFEINQHHGRISSFLKAVGQHPTYWCWAVYLFRRVYRYMEQTTIPRNRIRLDEPQFSYRMPDFLSKSTDVPTLNVWNQTCHRNMARATMMLGIRDPNAPRATKIWFAYLLQWEDLPSNRPLPVDLKPYTFLVDYTMAVAPLSDQKNVTVRADWIKHSLTAYEMKELAKRPDFLVQYKFCMDQFLRYIQLMGRSISGVDSVQYVPPEWLFLALSSLQQWKQYFPELQDQYQNALTLGYDWRQQAPQWFHHF